MEEYKEEKKRRELKQIYIKTGRSNLIKPALYVAKKNNTETEDCLNIIYKSCLVYKQSYEKTVSLNDNIISYTEDDLEYLMSKL